MALVWGGDGDGNMVSILESFHPYFLPPPLTRSLSHLPSSYYKIKNSFLRYEFCMCVCVCVEGDEGVENF